MCEKSTFVLVHVRSKAMFAFARGRSSLEFLKPFLKALDPNKATGPDSIPPRLLKETAQQIAPSLTKLFNRSLSCGIFPDDWKLANIVPVHKKGDKRYVENYRPISLSFISKVFERCVLTNARDHLLDLINCSQNGFIPGKSCTTQLLAVTTTTTTTIYLYPKEKKTITLLQFT